MEQWHNCKNCKADVLYESIIKNDEQLDIQYESITHFELCEKHQFIDTETGDLVVTIDEEICEPIEHKTALETKLEEVSTDMTMLGIAYYQMNADKEKNTILSELGRLYIRCMELSCELEEINS